MPEVTAVAEAAAEMAAPAVTAGSLDGKKVAVVATGVVVVAGLGYVTYRIIKKRKAEKPAAVEVNPETVEPQAEAEPAK